MPFKNPLQYLYVVLIGFAFVGGIFIFAEYRNSPRVLSETDDYSGIVVDITPTPDPALDQLEPTPTEPELPTEEENPPVTIDPLIATISKEFNAPKILSNDDTLNADEKKKLTRILILTEGRYQMASEQIKQILDRYNALTITGNLDPRILQNISELQNVNERLKVEINTFRELVLQLPSYEKVTDNIETYTAKSTEIKALIAEGFLLISNIENYLQNGTLPSSESQ